MKFNPPQQRFRKIFMSMCICIVAHEQAYEIQKQTLKWLIDNEKNSFPHNEYQLHDTIYNLKMGYLHYTCGLSGKYKVFPNSYYSISVL